MRCILNCLKLTNWFTAWIGLLLILFILPFPVRAKHRATSICSIFIIVNDSDRIKLKRVTVPDNHIRVFRSNPDTGIIDVILPPGPGGSGSLEDINKERLIIVSCRNGNLKVSTKLPSGKEYNRPIQAMDSLFMQDIWVNVIGPNGLTFKGRISGYQNFQADVISPLIDPFGGNIKLNSNQYIVYTETFKRQDYRKNNTGQATLEFIKGYYCVNVKLPNTNEGCLIIDLGSKTTVLTKAFLVDQTMVRRMERTVYTPDGVKRLTAVIGGATGEITHIIGSANIPQIDLIGFKIKNINAIILDTLPTVEERKIVGILGLDILSLFKNIRIYNIQQNQKPAKMQINASNDNKDAYLQIPFSFVGNIFIRGKINGKSVVFILDSGAPISILDKTSALSIGLKIDKPSGYILGLGGQRSKVWKTYIQSLQLGNRLFSDVMFNIASLQIFNSYRKYQYIGILGNSFLSQFSAFEINFEAEVLRFYK